MSNSCITNKGSFSEECLSEIEVLILSFSALRIFGMFIISFQMLLCDPVLHYVLYGSKKITPNLCHPRSLFTVSLIVISEKLMASASILLNS